MKGEYLRIWKGTSPAGLFRFTALESWRNCRKPRRVHVYLGTWFVTPTNHQTLAYDPWAWGCHFVGSMLPTCNCNAVTGLVAPTGSWSMGWCRMLEKLGSIMYLCEIVLFAIGCAATKLLLHPFRWNAYIQGRKPLKKLCFNAIKTSQTWTSSSIFIMPFSSKNFHCVCYFI